MPAMRAFHHNLFIGAQWRHRECLAAAATHPDPRARRTRPCRAFRIDSAWPEDLVAFVTGDTDSFAGIGGGAQDVVINSAVGTATRASVNIAYRCFEYQCERAGILQNDRSKKP